MSQAVEGQRFLLCRLANCWCALGLQGLGEIMRPQPVDPVAKLPEFVDGVAVIRGLALPVINLPRLLCGTNSPPGPQERFVTAVSNGHQLALRVDEVSGIFPMKSDIWHSLPSMLESVHGEHLAAVGSLDGELLMLLKRTNLLSQEDWNELQS